MSMKSQMSDGTLNRSISQNSTEEGIGITESADESVSLMELLAIDIVDSKKILECK
jgi:hypothetical protein